jgi:hypothetical protein
MVWTTYLVIHFGTGGKKPSEIIKNIENLGFSANLGPVDLVYIWPKEPTKEDVLELADKISEVLNGTESVFNLDTHNQ